MRNRIGTFLFISLAAVLPLVGLGCKGPSTEEVAATRPRTIEYWTMFDDLDALKPIIDTYKAERPYLTINVRQYRPEEFYTLLV